MAKEKKDKKDMDESVSNKKHLKAIHWRINPKALAKALELDVAEFPKKGSLDLTELLELPKGVGLTYTAADGLVVTAASKSSLEDAIQYVLDVHNEYGIGFFTQNDEPRIFGNASLPKSIMTGAGFVFDEEEEIWYFANEAESESEPEEKKVEKKKPAKEKEKSKTEKKGKKDKKVKDADEKKPTKKAKAEKPKKEKKAKEEKKPAKATQAKTVRRDPAALAELLSTAVETALEEDAELMGFKISVEAGFELSGYKRLNQDYFNDLIAMLEEYGLAVHFGDKYWILTVLESATAFPTLKKGDLNRAVKALQKAALSVEE